MKGKHGRNKCVEQARSRRNLSFHLLKELYGETQGRVYNGLAAYPLQCTLRIRGQGKIYPVWIVNTGNMSVLLGPRLPFNPVGSQRCPSPLAQAQGG